MPVRSVRALVLVVDDEPMIREILAEWLVEEGYRVHCAADGQEALDLVGAEIPDVIVTDIRMPRVHGLQLVERLRANGQAVPVVFISAHYVGVDVPGVRFVGKPFDLGHISAAVAQSLAGA